MIQRPSVIMWRLRAPPFVFISRIPVTLTFLPVTFGTRSSSTLFRWARVEGRGGLQSGRPRIIRGRGTRLWFIELTVPRLTSITRFAVPAKPIAVSFRRLIYSRLPIGPGGTVTVKNPTLLLFVVRFISALTQWQWFLTSLKDSLPLLVTVLTQLDPNIQFSLTLFPPRTYWTTLR